MRDPLTQNILMLLGVTALIGVYIGWAAAHLVAARKRGEEFRAHVEEHVLPSEPLFVDHARRFGLAPEEG